MKIENSTDAAVTKPVAVPAVAAVSTPVAPRKDTATLPPPGIPSISGISIKTTVEDVEESAHRVTDVEPLTQETLERWWGEAAKELKLEEVMVNGTPKMGETNGMFEVDATTVYFAEEFKPHKIDVMEFLREKTGMRMLDCRVNPLFVSKEEVVYSPDDKYKAMLERNPQLAELRKLFPMIDY